MAKNATKKQKKKTDYDDIDLMVLKAIGTNRFFRLDQTQYALARTWAKNQIEVEEVMKDKSIVI